MINILPRSYGSVLIMAQENGHIKGDTVFTGSGDWYLKPPNEIPWDNVSPPITENTTDYYIYWSEPIRLTYFEGDDWRPKAVVEDSMIHLIWRHDGWGINDIYYKRSTDYGETWTDTFNLSETRDCFAHYPAIAASEHNFVIFWKYSAGGRELHYSRSESGGSEWENMGRYDFYTSSPIICLLQEGLNILFYSDLYNSGLWYDFTTDWGGSWLGQHRLSYIGPAGRDPKVVSSGNYIHFGLANSGPTNSTEIFYHNSSDLGQTWSIDNLITEDDGIASQWPDNAVHDSVVIISWFDYKYGGSEIIVVRSIDNGLSWEDEYRISYSHVARDCHIIADDVGTFVVWNDARHSDSSNSELYLRASFDDGDTWEPEERVTYAVGASSEPYLVIDENTLYLFWIDTRDSLGYYEIYFKKGNIIMTGIEEDSTNLPIDISLSVSPNPFNATTTIHYSLPEPSNVILEIFNLFGQKIETLIDDYQDAGYKSIIWNASAYSSGIYFYKFTADDVTLTRRMVLIK